MPIRTRFLEDCPHCGQQLDPRQHRYRASWRELSQVSYWLRIDGPLGRLQRHFAVRCPHCSQVFISQRLRFLGLFRYEQLPWLFAGFVLLLIACKGLSR